MKKPGIIGGVGPESTIQYYRYIIQKFQKKLNTNNYPEIVLHSINMTEMLSYVANKQYDKLTDFLAERIKVLEKGGADFAAIASNTPHIVFEQVAKLVNIPLISIVEETCKEVIRRKIKRVSLFGTKSTMTSGFYNEASEKLGIEIIIPNTAKQNYIHEKYMGELVFNKLMPETKKGLIEIASELQEDFNIQGLILGGTELPLILQQADFNTIEIFDTTQIHVESIVERMW